jgi:hypothetical protein
MYNERIVGLFKTLKEDFRLKHLNALNKKENQNYFTQRNFSEQKLIKHMKESTTNDITRN